MKWWQLRKLSPELAAGIRRVKGVMQLGSRTGNWLSREQARMLLEKADGRVLRSLRDLAIDLYTSRLRIAACRAVRSSSWQSNNSRD